MSAHSIMVAFEGVPAIYFNSLFGTSNDEAKYVITGNNRDINRYRWSEKNILKLLQDKRSKQSIFYEGISNLLLIRKKQKAFHPNAYRSTLDLSPKIFCFKRVSIDKKQTILCMTNLSSKVLFPKIDRKYNNWKNLLDNNSRFVSDKKLKLNPFQTIWLSNN